MTVTYVDPVWQLTVYGWLVPGGLCALTLPG